MKKKVLFLILPFILVLTNCEWDPPVYYTLTINVNFSSWTTDADDQAVGYLLWLDENGDLYTNEEDSLLQTEIQDPGVMPVSFTFDVLHGTFVGYAIIEDLDGTGDTSTGDLVWGNDPASVGYFEISSVFVEDQTINIDPWESAFSGSTVIHN